MLSKILKIFSAIFATFLIAGSASAMSISVTPSQDFQTIGGIDYVLGSATSIVTVCSTAGNAGTFFDIPNYEPTSLCNLDIKGLVSSSLDSGSVQVRDLDTNGNPIGGYYFSLVSAFPSTNPSQVFTFVDPNVSGATSDNLSAVLVPSVSNLWPILLIIVGLILVFYTLNKIAHVFRMGTGSKKYRNGYGGKVKYKNGSPSVITFDKKK